MTIKEFGSDFHYTEEFPITGDELYLYDYIKHDYHLHYSGRTALYSIVEHGILNFGWKNIFVPEYFCHEVINFVKKLPINVLTYKDGPYVNKFKEDEFDAIDSATNAIFVVNYFGTQSQKVIPIKEAYIIEDHTHSLTSTWAQKSVAHFCIASLRKSLPIPSGGVYWSPKGLDLPTKNAGDEHYIASSFFMKFAGMFLKSDYLKGKKVDKTDFRNLYIESESMFGDIQIQGRLPEFGEKLIHSIPLNTLSNRKRDNYNILQQNLTKEFHLLNVLDDSSETPLGLVIIMNNKQERDNFKSFLIEKSIYPAVLWPNQIQSDAIDFSEKLIFLHCDFRYSSEDMEYLAIILNSYYSN